MYTPLEKKNTISPIARNELKPILKSNLVSLTTQRKKYKSITLSNSLVIQRVNYWVRDSNKYKIVDPNGENMRNPNENEIMEERPPKERWRPNTVWRDSEGTEKGKWFEKTEEGLKDRKEIGDLLITPLKISEYKGEDNQNFGHRFQFSVWMNAKSIEWNERTDKPYDAVPEENIWTDLYPTCKDSSDVFSESREIKDYDKEYFFDDPPGILKIPNNRRKLEFYLKFKDKNDVVKSIKAEQNLETDKDGKIIKQQFEEK